MLIPAGLPGDPPLCLGSDIVIGIIEIIEFHGAYTSCKVATCACIGYTMGLMVTSTCRNINQALL